MDRQYYREYATVKFLSLKIKFKKYCLFLFCFQFNCCLERVVFIPPVTKVVLLGTWCMSFLFHCMQCSWYVVQLILTTKSRSKREHNEQSNFASLFVLQMPPDPKITIHPDDRVPQPNVILTVKVYRPRINPAFLPKVGTTSNITIEWICINYNLFSISFGATNNAYWY